MKGASASRARRRAISVLPTLKVMIPGKDVDLLTGATLDYTESQGLVIRNPNRPAAPNVEGLMSDDELSTQVTRARR